MAPEGAWHVGRSWSGHAIENACPCPQAPCGLVSTAVTDAACEHHPIYRGKTVRQGHPAEDCPVDQEATTGGLETPGAPGVPSTDAGDDPTER